jgi:succinate dehydrogenase / fumarate reductase membrane anchor subunit
MRLGLLLSRVLSPGSNKQSTYRWFAQRLTAIVLIPLSFWFIYALLCMTSMEHFAIIEWMSSPYICALLILFIISLFYHAQLGVQEVIEDYVGGPLMVGSIIILNIIALVTGLASVLAVLKVFLHL